MKTYVMVVEWYDYGTRTPTRFDHKANYTCTAVSVDEAMHKAKARYDAKGRFGLVVTSIYSE